MPVTTRYSASLDRPYEDQNPSSPPPFTAQDIGSASGAHSTPNGSLSSYSRTNSVDSLDSTGSSSTGGGGGGSAGSSTNGHSRQVSNDSTAGSPDFIPTRSIKQASKPQHNPLQFVKVGSCQLYKKAEQQIKKAEEVKKMTTVKQEAEEWQHNLDDWKQKRRKSHVMVERAEELKKLEEVEHDRRRRKSKTFNEMMEERSKRGHVGLGLRKLSYPADWDDNEVNSRINGHLDNGSPKLDLSLDSTGSDQVFHDDSSISETSSIDKNMDNDLSPQDEPKNNNSVHKNGINGNTDSNMKVPESNTPSATNTEEYTFDKAIETYVQYAEAQKKSGNRDKKTSNGDSQALSSSRWKSDIVDGEKNGVTNGKSYTPKVEKVAKVDPKVERTGGHDMSIVVTIKPGAEPRDFGFTTKGQGHGMVFVEHIAPRGAAEAAGLQVNDEILSINGEGASNRNHSAIVFAIKQAVYTGWLELHVYRYDNATEAPSFNPPKTVASTPNQKVSRVEERKAAFCKENSFEKELTPEKKPFVREKSPKVDIVKRRSLFESPSRDNAEVQLNRRSLDASNALKNRIASFENLDTIDGRSSRKSVTPDRSTTPDRIAGTIKDKLQSYETKDSSDRLSEKKPVKSCRSDFRKRLASFESDKPSETKTPVSAERKRSLKEKIATFEKVEPFERSQSCDLLDAIRDIDRSAPKEKSVPNLPPAIEDEVDSSSLHNWVNEPVLCEDDGSPPRIIDIVTKEDSPEPQPEPSITPMKAKETFQEVLPRTASPVSQAADTKRNECEQPAASSNLKEKEEPVVEEVIQKTLSPTRIPKEQPPISNGDVALSLDNTVINKTDSCPQQPALLEDHSPKVNGLSSTESDNEADRMEQQILHQLEQAEQNKPLPTDTPLEVSFDLLDLTNMGEEVIIVDDFDFDSPPRMVEPPTEKPPPPPVDMDSSSEQQSPDLSSSKLKRVESTKRIRKEIYRRRTDFLGIEPSDECKYIDIDVTSPPKLESPLRSEKPVESSVGYVNMNGHGSIPSEGNNVPTQNGIHSPRLQDDDDIARKEREIIEDLEREEQLKKDRYKHANGDDDGRVRRLEEERRQMEQERHFREEERIRLEEEKKLREREEQLRCQEELLRLEREKLRQEQEDLMRQREEYQRQIQQHQQIYTSPKPSPPRASNQLPLSTGHVNGDYELIVHPIDHPIEPIPAPRMSKTDSKPVASPNTQKMPSSNSESRQREEVVKREEVIKSSRRPGVANKAKPLEKKPLEDNAQVVSNGSQAVGNGPQPMSKHTLYALSASPKAKLTEGERWMAKRKPDAPKRDPAAYNQHWLIQEAEMRRISDHQNRLRQAKSPTREATPPETSLPQNYQQQQQQQQQPQHQPQPQQRRLPPPPKFIPPRLNLSDNIDMSRPTVPSQSSREQNNTKTPRSPQDRRDYVELAGLAPQPPPKNHSPQSPVSPNGDSQMLSVSGKKKCSHCGEELGRGAAMIIESLQLFYHIHCFKCCVCHVQLGNGLSGADVRVRSQKLHCHNCYSNDEVRQDPQYAEFDVWTTHYFKMVQITRSLRCASFHPKQVLVGEVREVVKSFPYCSRSEDWKLQYNRTLAKCLQNGVPPEEGEKKSYLA